MRTHVPNNFPAKVRTLSVFAAVFLFGYGIAELAIGYTAIPIKRAGLIMFSGTATLMIATGTLLLCVASLLIIADHYDTRDNETHYKKVRQALTKTAFALLFFSPLSELVVVLLRAYFGIEVPDYQGFARNSTWHTPALAKFAPANELLPEGGLIVTGLATLITCYGCIRWGGPLLKRVGTAFGGVGTMCFALLFISSVVSDFVSGRTSVGRRNHKQHITAAADPARFNAALLTKSIVSGIFFLTGIACFMVVIMPREEDA